MMALIKFILVTLLVAVIGFFLLTMTSVGISEAVKTSDSEDC
jgi:hypothetical protein